MRQTITVTALLLLGLSAGARATTPLEGFQKAIAKHAGSLTGLYAGKIKQVCACLDTANAGKPGAVVIVGTGPITDIFISCVVPTYDGDGNVTGGAGCNAWVPLP